MRIIPSILFLGFSLFFIQQAKSQNLANYLTGGSTRTWELHSIAWADGSHLESEEFGEGEGDSFTQENDEATTIPETIVFKSDGTCELTYVAYYSDGDGDGDEDLWDQDWTLSGKWKISNGNVIISEENGYTWTLTGVQINTADQEIEGGYDYHGFNSGIQSLGYFIDGEE